MIFVTIYTHTKLFKWIYSTWGIMLLPEVIGCQIESPVSSLRQSLLNSWFQVSYRPTRLYKL